MDEPGDYKFGNLHEQKWQIELHNRSMAQREFFYVNANMWL